MTFCDTPAGIRASVQTFGKTETWRDGQTDVVVEIVIYIAFLNEFWTEEKIF